MDDPLPSWNDRTSKSEIIDFDRRVTTQGDSDFIPVEKRIVTFDKYGTLWSEQPMKCLLIFALEHVKALALMHPEWKDEQSFMAVLEDDLKKVMDGCVSPAAY